MHDLTVHVFKAACQYFVHSTARRLLHSFCKNQTGSWPLLTEQWRHAKRVSTVRMLPQSISPTGH